MPSYDVVVPTIGRSSLPRLLAALAEGRGPAPERVIVVDDRPGPQAKKPKGAAKRLSSSRFAERFRPRSGGSDRPLLPGGPPPGLGAPCEIVAGPAAGPAAARNRGWRAASAEWVAFLDDDVVPDPDWAEGLAADLASTGADVAGVQGRLRVPLPAGRRPTDWERNVAGLEAARWATADMAYRRSALDAVGGFDERFPRAFREDADLALRLVSAGWRLTVGRRTAAHPVRPAGPWVSVRLQAGNADDALMAALHGRRWHQAAGAPRGRIARHLATTAAGLAAAVGLVTGRPRLAAGGAAGWLAGTIELAWARIAPGPRTPAEIATMTATSAVLPAAATWHRLHGEVRARLPSKRQPRLVPTTPSGPAEAPEAQSPASTAGGGAGVPAASEEGGPAGLASASLRLARRSGGAPPGAPKAPATQPANTAGPGLGPPAPEEGGGGAPPGAPKAPATRPQAVLLDRDGTLVVDVPYNGDPARVVPVPGARGALDRLRAAGVRLAVVSNQSGVARGLVTTEQVDAVNRRVEELLGPLGPWLVCPHGPDEGCGCRKPEAGLVRAAASAVGVPAERCAVIGDIGADMDAARAAGARGVLVPTAATRPEEVAAADEVVPDLPSAVDLLLGGSR